MLRTAADARLLRASLANVRTALVIGGGYIGLEAAASLRSLDIDFMVEMAPLWLAWRQSHPEHYAALHRQHDIQSPWHNSKLKQTYQENYGRASSGTQSQLVPLALVLFRIQVWQKRLTCR